MKMQRLRRPKDDRGAALLSALLVMLLMAGVTAGFTALVITDTRVRALDSTRTQSFYAVHAGLEKLTSDIGDLFAGTVAPTASQVNALADAPPKGSAQIVLNEATVSLPLGSLIDLQAEAARLQKELAKVTEEIARLHKKLSNEKFVANAPEEVVEAEREKLAEYREAQEKLSVALTRVRDAG